MHQRKRKEMNPADNQPINSYTFTVPKHTPSLYNIECCKARFRPVDINVMTSLFR